MLNAQKAKQTRSALLKVSGLFIEEQEEEQSGMLPTELPVYKANLEREEAMRAKLLPLVEERARQLSVYTSQLKRRYTELQRAWESSLPKRERERDARLERKQLQPGAAGAAAAAAASGGRDRGAMGGQSSRRDRSFGSFDVVRSEEEMNAVIAQLAAEEKRERSDTWIATQCARDTPMILEPTKALMVRFECRNGLIEDPIAEEKERKRKSVWTDREKKIFFDKWIIYPKLFRRIKSFLKWKTVADCVR